MSEFFEGRQEARALFDAVRVAVSCVGAVTERTSTSQIAFRRRRTFAAVWTPDRYLRGRTAPLVLTVYLARRDPSPRWKEVVEASPGRYTHHLELYEPREVDDEVGAWLQEAWQATA